LVREHNEDCAAVDGRILNEGVVTTFTVEGDGHLLLVADGMGGHAKGEIASKLAIDGLNRLAPRIIDTSSCIDSVRMVNRELYEAMNRDESLRGMGTTIVGVVLQCATAIWFNVGDSRAYLFRGELRQLTTDHIPARNSEPTGHRSHAITQSLGGRFSASDVWPAAGNIEVMPEDKIIICSDGLTDLLSDEEMAGFLQQGVSAQQAVLQLVEAALTRGAPDNVTVIVASL
jgi:protein phosphatase